MPPPPPPEPSSQTGFPASVISPELEHEFEREIAATKSSHSFAPVEKISNDSATAANDSDAAVDRAYMYHAMAHASDTCPGGYDDLKEQEAKNKKNEQRKVDKEAARLAGPSVGVLSPAQIKQFLDLEMDWMDVASVHLMTEPDTFGFNDKEDVPIQVGLFFRRNGELVALFRVDTGNYKQFPPCQTAPIAENNFGSVIGGTNATSSSRWSIRYSQPFNFGVGITAAQRRHLIVKDHEEEFGTPPTEPAPGGVVWMA